MNSTALNVSEIYPGDRAVPLILTADYPPPPNIAARRNVDQVTISWVMSPSRSR